jgi:hypothetical protein
MNKSFFVSWTVLLQWEKYGAIIKQSCLQKRLSKFTPKKFNRIASCSVHLIQI